MRPNLIDQTMLKIILLVKNSGQKLKHVDKKEQRLIFQKEHVDCSVDGV